MNTSVKIMQQTSLSRDWVLPIALTRANSLVMSLIAGVLISAFSMIYVTNTSRNLQMGIQQTLAERSQLHIQWSQLLLEKSTWTMQARVQHVAENQMGMMIPNHKSVVIVNE